MYWFKNKTFSNCVKRGTGFSRRINGNLINYITFSYKSVDNILRMIKLCSTIGGWGHFSDHADQVLVTVQ